MRRYLFLFCITLWGTYTSSQTISQAYIYTPNGTLVSDTYSLSGLINPTYNQSQINTIEHLLDSLDDGATLLDTADYRYNCHAYAWHMSYHPSAEPVWMGWQTSTAEDIYWTDGSYVEVPEAIATKVSYHQSGNHSAVRESSTWYKSKWGGGFLVRHHPDAVPNGIATPIINPSGTNYCPTLSKNYYLLKPCSSISGPALIYSYDIFSIDDLQSGYTVQWSLSDNYYNTHNLLMSNYPTIGQCLIVRDVNHDLRNATLTATIKKDGYTVMTLPKTGINAYDDFWGQYTSGNLSGEIDYTHVFQVKPNWTTYITSPNFYGATVTYSSSGATPSIWGFSPTCGDLTFVTTNTSVPVVINVDDAFGNNYVLFAFPINSYSLNVSYGDNGIIISLNGSDESSMDTNVNQPWTVEIRNATMGELMATQSSTSRSTTISTAGWPKGMYVVRVTVGKEVLTEKVIVK